MSFAIQCQLCLAAASTCAILVRADSTLPAQFLNPRHHSGSYFPQGVAATQQPLRGKEGCCEAKTADCIACIKGVSKEELCANDSHLPGCSSDIHSAQQQACCEAMTAECIACRRGIGQREVCDEDVHISGCPQLASDARRRSCCDAMNAECVACRMGISRRELCQQDVSFPGCSSFPHSNPKPKFCCKALTAECVACNSGMVAKLLCEKAPHTSGCKKHVHGSGMPRAKDVKRAHWVQNPWLFALHVTTLAAVCGGLVMAIVCWIHLQPAQQAPIPLLTMMGGTSEDTTAQIEAVS